MLEGLVVSCLGTGGHAFSFRGLDFATATEDDAAFVARVWNDLSTLNAQRARPRDQDEIRLQLKKSAASTGARQRRTENFIVRGAGTSLADASIYVIDAISQPVVGVGLNVAPEVRAQGVGTICFAALRSFAANHLGAAVVLAGTAPDNGRARRALSNADFRLRKSDVDWPRPDGTVVKSFVYGWGATPRLAASCPHWMSLPSPPCEGDHP